MFRIRFNVAQLGVVACATISLSGCQDAAAPVSAPEILNSVPVVRASRESAPGRNVIKDQYIVVFRDGSGDVDVLSKRLIGKTKGKLKHTYKSGLQGFAGAMTAEEAAELANDPSVAYVEADQVVSVVGGKNGGSSGTITEKRAPWGLDRIDQQTLPLSGTFTYSATGAGVNAYIIDSGIRTTHIEFGGRATADFSTIDDGYGATGCYWHGTHVAGIVGGATAGVAKGALLHSVRVLDCSGSGSESDVIAGIDWVAANHVKPAVANLSLIAGFSQALNDAVERLVAAGVVVTLAAGNDAADACNYSPSSAARGITVGSSSSDDYISPFSNRGPCLDILAPGHGIKSATNDTNRSMMIASGTSMAAPNVAGIVAIFLQGTPSASPDEVAQMLVGKSTLGVLQGLDDSTPNRLARY